MKRNKFFFISNGSSKKLNSVFYRRTLPLKFMDDFFFFLCDLSDDLSSGLKDMHFSFSKSISNHLLFHFNNNIHIKNRRKKRPFYFSHIKRTKFIFNKQLYRISKIQRRFKHYYPYYYFNSKKWFSSLNSKKHFYSFLNIDIRYLIFTFFNRSLMLNTHIYSIYGNNICIFSFRFNNWHIHMDFHGSDLFKNMLNQPVSFIFR